MKPGILRTLGVLVTVLLHAHTASAHRLDEYLQATRIGVEAGTIQLDCSLTPGAAIAEDVLATIDADHDGQISQKETEDYVAHFVASLTLNVDGRLVPLSAGAYQFPSAADMRTGNGVLRLQATAIPAPLAFGPHHLRLTNAHRADVGVYLVNALVPADPRVRIESQSRDLLQREFDLDFALAKPETGIDKAAAAVPPALALGLAALVYTFARRLKETS